MAVQMWEADESAASAVAPGGPQDSQAAGTDLESPAGQEPNPLAAIHQPPSPSCQV